MKKILIILAILMINTACALEVNIQTKSSFNKGEQLYFDYSISSDVQEEIEYVPYISCESLAPAPLETRKANLTGIPYENTYYGLIVGEVPPQTCSAGIIINEPFFFKEEKTFEITTNPQVDLTLSLNKKVFTKGENIEITYSSGVANLDIQASLTYPDGTVEKIFLPASLRAVQTGTYELEVRASAQGHEPVSRTEKFAVIERQAEIRSVSVCNANEICDSGENPQNCPQDCSKKELASLNLSQLLIVVLLLAIILVVVVLVMRKRKK